MNMAIETDTDTERKKRRRIVWTEEEQSIVLALGRRLYRQNPRMSNTSLINTAQEILDVSRRRNLPNFSSNPHNAWFLDHLDDPEPDYASFSPPEPPTPEPPPDILDQAYTEVPLDLMGVLDTLSRKLQEDVTDRDTARRELTAALMRIERMETRLEILVSTLQVIMAGGFTGTFYPATSVKAPAAAVQLQLDELISNGRMPTGDTRWPAPPISPPIPELKGRKPRILVLDLASGHEKHGIMEGTRGYVKAIDFTEHKPDKVQSLDAWDYVICTKRTPSTWVALAKASPWCKKIRVIPGNPRSHIIPAILALPPLEDGASE